MTTEIEQEIQDSLDAAVKAHGLAGVAQIACGAALIGITNTRLEADVVQQAMQLYRNAVIVEVIITLADLRKKTGAPIAVSLMKLGQMAHDRLRPESIKLTNLVEALPHAADA